MANRGEERSCEVRLCSLGSRDSGHARPVQVTEIEAKIYPKTVAGFYFRGFLLIVARKASIREGKTDATFWIRLQLSLEIGR